MSKFYSGNQYLKRDAAVLKRVVDTLDVVAGVFVVDVGQVGNHAALIELGDLVLEDTL